MTVTLKVEARTTSASSLRARGYVPGIVYGPKQEPVAISMLGTTLEKLVHEAGESTIIELTGLENPIEVLVYDVAFNVKKGGIEHIDFYAIERGKELTTNVPLEFEGEAPAVKLGGSLTKVLQEVEVTCRPAALPQHLTVDVSGLVDFDSQIKIKDIVLPEGVRIEAEDDDVVALVVQTEDEPEEDTAVDMDAIAVEKKGKGEEGGKD